MSEVKIASVSEAPEEGKAKKLSFDHPYTDIHYDLALLKVDGNYYVLTNDCKRCNGKLADGVIEGMYIICPADETPWHIRTGLCRFNRSMSMPTYKVKVENDALFINI